MSVRSVAVHEASHALVACYFGIPVVEIRVGERSGKTVRCAGGSLAEQAAITAAGEEGQRLVGVPFVDLSCDDLKSFEARFGLGLLWRARRDAAAVLASMRVDLLALSARLERERTIVFEAV